MADLILNDGRSMPQLGMGTWQIPDSHAASVVRAGLDLGFTLVDTAAIYANERGVGEGLGGSDAWVTTKLWNDRHEDPVAALDESLALLGRSEVDLYLIHWPQPKKGIYVDAWRTMVDLRAAGRTRSIGVSNFRRQDLDAIVAATGVAPAVNQIELHPYFQQADLRAADAEHGVVTQSWSPLGKGEVLRDPVIGRIAGKHGRSAAQVVIAWHLALGLAVIPRSGDAAHLADNIAALDLTLDDDDLAAIAGLDRGEEGRAGEHPDVT